MNRPATRLRHLAALALGLVSLIGGPACDKEDLASLTYADTLCSDPWDRGGDRDSASVLAAIRATLEGAGVTVVALTEDASGAYDIVCLACHCKSGIVYSLTTEADDVAKARAVGFE